MLPTTLMKKSDLRVQHLKDLVIFTTPERNNVPETKKFQIKEFIDKFAE